MADPTAITVQTMLGPFATYGAGLAAFTVAAGTLTNGDTFVCTGREILLCRCRSDTTRYFHAASVLRFCFRRGALSSRRSFPGIERRLASQRRRIVPSADSRFSAHPSTPRTYIPSRLGSGGHSSAAYSSRSPSCHAGAARCGGSVELAPCSSRFRCRLWFGHSPPRPSHRPA